MEGLMTELELREQCPISAIHKSYYGVYEEVMKSKLVPEAEKLKLYRVWCEIKKTPKKDWNKPEVREKLDKVFKGEDRDVLGD